MSERVDVAELRSQVKRLSEALKEALHHQVANLGHPESEFYSCYTYPHGEMPKWVKLASTALSQATPKEPPHDDPSRSK